MPDVSDFLRQEGGTVKKRATVSEAANFLNIQALSFETEKYHR